MNRQPHENASARKVTSGVGETDEARSSVPNDSVNSTITIATGIAVYTISSGTFAWNARPCASSASRRRRR